MACLHGLKCLGSKPPPGSDHIPGIVYMHTEKPPCSYSCKPTRLLIAASDWPSDVYYFQPNMRQP